MEYFDHLEWLIIPIGITAYFFLVPLLTLATHRQEAEPDVYYLDEDTKLPAIVRLHFGKVEEQLEELGFVAGDMLCLPHQMGNVKPIIQHFVHHQDRTPAMAVTMFVDINGTWKVGSQYVEFCTDFLDGSEVDTINSNDIGVFPEPDTKIVNWLSGINDLHRLYSAHCAMVDAHGPAESRVLKCESEFRGDLTESIAAGMTKDLERAARDGYLRLSTEGTHYRATFAGAYKITWKVLHPIKGLYRLYKKRVALRRLAAVGWPA